MLWLRACLHWNKLLFALHACTIDVWASVACAHVPLISAASFALLISLSDVFQPVAACHTWVSLAIAADVEKWSWDAMDMESERELCQFPLPERRRYQRYSARSLSAYILSRGRRECGWPGGERNRRRCSEMARMHWMVDSASCCPLRPAELLLRQRVFDNESSPQGRLQLVTPARGADTE